MLYLIWLLGTGFSVWFSVFLEKRLDAKQGKTSGKI